MSVVFMPVIVLLVLFALSSIKILKEYERGVVFRLGSYTGVRGPGLIVLIPVLEQMTKVDLRVVTMDIPSQVVAVLSHASVLNHAFTNEGYITTEEQQEEIPM